MCAICISDLHGNKAKAEAFIKYKPEEEHIHIGDSFDSYVASDNDIIDTFNLLMNNGVVNLFGNHDVMYLRNAHDYFICSGVRFNMIKEAQNLIENNKHLMKASIICDDFLISHGGLSTTLGKNFDTVEEANEWINSEFDWYKNNPVVPQTLSRIFDIGYCRGGRESVSGIFWLTYGRESYDHRFNQVCGHTCGDKVRISKHKNNILHVCVDTPKWHCFNTVTREVEDFFPPEFKDDCDARKMLERNF